MAALADELEQSLQSENFGAAESILNRMEAEFASVREMLELQTGRVS